MYTLLKHQIKEKLRSDFWQKSLIMNIFMIIMMAYMMINILVISFFADVFISKIFPDNNLTFIFTKLLFYYFAVDIILRFIFQKVSELSFQYYLHLPIKKSTLAHYPLTRSAFSFFNILGVLLVLPFFFKTVKPNNDLTFSMLWLAYTILMIAVNNFLSLLLKQFAAKITWLSVAIPIVLSAIIASDIIGITKLSAYYALTSYSIANNAYLIIIPVVILILIYKWVHINMKNNLYINETQSGTKNTRSNFTFLSKYGEIGSLLQLELKMIFRNKRPRVMIYFSPIYIGVFLNFYEHYNYAVLIFAGLYLTSIISIIYGQFLFQWESSYFDSLMANNISNFSYMKAKYILLAGSNIITFILTLPYGFISFEIILVNFAMLIFNTGVTSLLIIWTCTYSKSRIELNKSAFFNYEGTGASQFIMMFPIVIIPAIVYLIFYLLNITQYAAITLAAIGVLAIFFHEYLLQLVNKQFIRRRYIMSAAFRKK